jgi:threonylcarbamoyladenosine tRNA methylthiotransferase MtaB
MKIAFETLGCKLNQAETELLIRRFTGAGHRVVGSPDEADVFVLNTCTVTGMADDKSRHLVRLARRRNPRVIIAVTGCYAQRAAPELAEMEGVRIVAGNDDKLRLPEILQNLADSRKTGRKDSAVVSGAASRTRSFIKIQDGCNNFCSYCIVPYVRGREKSLPAESVIEEIKQRVSSGIREIVLTGTEIGSYRDGSIGLLNLLERVLAETDVARLRLSSLQPREITPELIDLWRDGRLCRHFHLSLQSGSDSVLIRMRRRYTTSDYEEAVSLIRSVASGAAITTDVIAGFPCETEEEFAGSLDFIRRTGFARLHVFSFSARPGTEAAGMAPRVPDSVKTQRNRILRAMGRECVKTYARRFAGSSLPVLWEQRTGGVWSGYTDNYIKVYTKSSEDLTNTVTPVKLTSRFRGDGVLGEVANLTE